MPFEALKGTPFWRYVLPIMPAGVKIHPKSELTPEHCGKNPGKWRREGWIGFAKWQEHDSEHDGSTVYWPGWYRAEGKPETIGLRTGDYVALDLDVTDKDLVDLALGFASIHLGLAPRRFREN